MFEDKETTYRAGAVYRITDDISAFGQYATSFEPQSASSQNPLAGGPFAPTEGDIYEGGLKTALMGGRIQSSLSAYRIRRTNILQTDPRGDIGDDGVDDLVSIGEITSKGIEFDLAADITPDWVVTVAYGYNDTRITADNGGGGFSNAVGDRFANAPEHQLGFWTRYQFPMLGLAAAVGGERRSVWPGEAVFGGGGAPNPRKYPAKFARSRPDPIQNFGKVSHISVKCINDAFYTYM